MYKTISLLSDKFLKYIKIYVFKLDSMHRRLRFQRFEIALVVIPAKAGIYISENFKHWIPAFTGMTPNSDSNDIKTLIKMVYMATQFQEIW